MLTSVIVVNIPTVEMNFVATKVCYASTTLDVDWLSSGNREGWAFLWMIIVIIGSYNMSGVCGAR